MVYKILYYKSMILKKGDKYEDKKPFVEIFSEGNGMRDANDQAKELERLYSETLMINEINSVPEVEGYVLHMIEVREMETKDSKDYTIVFRSVEKEISRRDNKVLSEVQIYERH